MTELEELKLQVKRQQAVLDYLLDVRLDELSNSWCDMSFYKYRPRLEDYGLCFKCSNTWERFEAIRLAKQKDIGKEEEWKIREDCVRNV